MTRFVPILLALLVAAALAALLILALCLKKHPCRAEDSALGYCRPKAWVAIMAAVVCAVVALLLLANPTQRGDQIQGVSIQQGYVVDGGVSVSLPQDLRDDLVHLLAQTKIGSYTAVDTYTPPEGAVILADGNDGTEFILSPDDPATLTRINHDGYTSLRKQTTLPQDFISDPALAAFWADVDTYLTTGRAE
jgi:hypothetical protein